MALNKSTDLGNGFTADYWRILGIHFDMMLDNCEIRVGLYKDQASREASLTTVSSTSYKVDRATIFDKEASTVSNPLAACYTYLKTLDDFSGATDV